MIKKSLIISLLLVFLFSIVGCSSKNYKETMKMPEKHFYSGSFLKAARMLLPQVNKKGKNQLLYMMECGYMLHAAGDYKNSNKVLLKAAKIAKIKKTSITKQTAALLTNETKSNYNGEDFEKVLIHMFIGINFIMLNDNDSARVEFKSVNEELSRVKVEGDKAKYKQNIMAKYLTAIAFEIVADLNKDEDDLEYAYKEYEQIYKLKPSLKLVYGDLQRLSKKLNYLDDYSKWRKKFGKQNIGTNKTGELVVIFQSGLSAIKESRGPLLKDSQMKSSINLSLNTMSLSAGVTIGAVMIALRNAENPIPFYKARSNNIKYATINTGKTNQRMVKLESIQDTAIKTLNDDYGRLKKKVAASIAVKAAASIAAGLLAKKIAESSRRTKGFAGVIGYAVGLGTGAALISQMKPDLRCWHTLPANLQLGKLHLKPGKHKIFLDFIGKNITTGKKLVFDIEIAKGKKSFINTRSLY